MTRLTAKDFPQQLLEYYDYYAHGKISKREFLQLAGKYTVGGMTALALFNLLPIPPLDGSKVLMMLLPYRQSAWLERNQRYLSLALWILILVGVLSTPLSYLSNWIMHFFVWATQWIGTLVQMVM